MAEIEFTDRYQALGLPYPDPETMCRGQCEGTGFVPITQTGSLVGDPRFPPLWLAAHRRKCSFVGRIRNILHGKFRYAFERCDGYHFVVCPDCNGTRLRNR